MRSVASTLVKIYPAAPALADEWLAEEIRRAACDPGALGVFWCGARRGPAAARAPPPEPDCLACVSPHPRMAWCHGAAAIG